MGILEELGLTEDDLDPSAYSPSVSVEPVSEKVVVQEEEFFRKLREGEFDTPDHPGYPDESETESIIDEIAQEVKVMGGVTGEMGVFPVNPETGSKKPIDTKKPKSKRVVYSVACTLHLSGSDYQVQLLPESTDYDKAYRLNKIGSQKPVGYNVIQIDGEIICECHDFKFRQDGTDSKGCKHIRGLVDLGMFASPSVSYRTGSGIFDG